MSSRDTDFEFDFFEEPETQEAPGGATARCAGRSEAAAGPGCRAARCGRRAGFTPLLRLLGLIAFAILIVVLLLLWVQSCQEDAKRDAYSSYMTDMSAVARDSERIGRELSDVADDAGDQARRAAEAARGPRPAAGDRRRARSEARSARAAARLRTSTRSSRSSFRADGLAGLSEAFQRTQGSKDAAAAGALLASQAERLVASDVVWDDLFKEPSVATLREEEISGVEVPDSNFVQTPDLASTRSMVPIWERINGSLRPARRAARRAGCTGRTSSTVNVVPGGQVALGVGARTRSRPRPTSRSRSRSRTAATARR